jgi:aryl-alcohol dehydrogenase-like predicted oxidoreductase
MMEKMRYLDRADFPASVLGFGCSAVLGRVGKQASLRALETAWDAGINLFDVARSYGYGEAEALLGEFLAGKRDKALIATKFGILPQKQQSWKHAAKPIVRAALRFAPGARSLVRRGISTQMTPNQFTVDVLRESLDASLRALRTDYVDCLFLHSAPAEILEQSDLFEALARVVEQGKARYIGISADSEVIELALRHRLPVLQAMQFPANLNRLTNAKYPADETLFFANHPFGGVTGVAESRARIAALAVADDVSPELRAKLTGNTNLLLADLVFSLILRGTGVDAVICSMMNPANLKTNVEAMNRSRFSDEEIAFLRSKLQAST